MKTRFIQACYALILPIIFIAILILLNAVPLNALNKYSFGGVLITIIALLITFVAVKKDGKTFKEIGFSIDKNTPVRFVKGFLIGLVIVTLMLAIMICLSDLEITLSKKSNITEVLFWLLAFFPLAYMEEVIFRGYAFTKSIGSIGIWPTQILLAILFTWYHDFTGATFLNQLIGPGVWALVYGIAAIWSKGIALPTGLHMALNVGLALVGQKDGRAGVWDLYYPQDVTLAMETQTERIGLIMQIGILIIAILLTEYYRRNKMKNHKRTSRAII